MADSDLAFNRVESEDDQVNVLGDQDAVNLADSTRYPPDAHTPTAQNVRRYPELFDQAVIDSFAVVDEEADANAVVDDDDNVNDGHFTSQGF